MENENQQANESTGAENTNETAPNAPSELDVLKQRARVMNITFSNNIGLEALRAKVNAKMQGEEEQAEEQAQQDKQENEQEQAPATTLNPLAGDTDTKAISRMSKRDRIRAEALALVRVRITNMDPKKKDLPGEVLTIGNRYVGTVRKFIPYGEVTDNGYHIPKILYDELENRRFVNIRTTKDRSNGQIRVTHSMAKEFAIEVLPPLTKEELKDLATAQAAAGSIE